MRPTDAEPRVWFPAIKTGAGVDVFTERLVRELNRYGIQAEITWLPGRAEYLPNTVKPPQPPNWANIVHINSWLSSRFISTDLPIVVTVHHVVHDPGLISYKSHAQRLYHRFWIKPMERQALSKATAVTTVSHYSAQKIKEIFSLRNPRVFANWVDTDTYIPLPKEEPEKPFRLLYVGSWSKRKGYDLLPYIMEELGSAYKLLVVPSEKGVASRDPDWPFNMELWGSGRRLSEFELVQAYQQSDALLFPSRLEGFGLVALEAMACGLPVIGTRGSAISEIVEDDVSGLLCPQDDVSAFAAAVRRLAEHPSLWKRISHLGRAQAVHAYQAEQIIGQYIDMYRGVISH